MKKSTSSFITLIFLSSLYFKAVLSKDPVSDFDLAWTIHSMGDTDRNNILDVSEITNFYVNEIQFPRQLADFVAKSMVDRGDTNNDNGLSLDETIMAMESVRH